MLAKQSADIRMPADGFMLSSVASSLTVEQALQCNFPPIGHKFVAGREEVTQYNNIIILAHAVDPASKMKIQAGEPNTKYSCPHCTGMMKVRFTKEGSGVPVGQVVAVVACTCAVRKGFSEQKELLNSFFASLGDAKGAVVAYLTSTCKIPIIGVGTINPGTKSLPKGIYYKLHDGRFIYVRHKVVCREKEKKHVISTFPENIHSEAFAAMNNPPKRQKTLSAGSEGKQTAGSAGIDGEKAATNEDWLKTPPDIATMPSDELSSVDDNNYPCLFGDDNPKSDTSDTAKKPSGNISSVDNKNSLCHFGDNEPSRDITDDNSPIDKPADPVRCLYCFEDDPKFRFVCTCPSHITSICKECLIHTAKHRTGKDIDKEEMEKKNNRSSIMCPNRHPVTDYCLRDQDPNETAMPLPFPYGWLYQRPYVSEKDMARDRDVFVEQILPLHQQRRTISGEIARASQKLETYKDKLGGITTTELDEKTLQELIKKAQHTITSEENKLAPIKIPSWATDVSAKIPIPDLKKKRDVIDLVD